MRFPEHDHVVETFPSDCADQSLDVRILPRRARRNEAVDKITGSLDAQNQGMVTMCATQEPQMLARSDLPSPSIDLLRLAGRRRFSTILADPPWQFTNKTGKVAPEHKRLSRYGTMKLSEIMALPVGDIAAPTAHLYLWCPNALLPDGLAVMQAWGFQYKSNIVWHKVRKDGGPDGRGVGFYFRNVTELILFGVKGKNARTLAPGRRQVNFIATRKREHSRKPDEQYEIIETCSSAPYLELFARGTRKNWSTWGNQADKNYAPTWKTYAHHSQVGRAAIG